MDTVFRERRSHAREFIEVPASLRGLINNVIEDLQLIRDELDADAEEQGETGDEQ